mmetsp:Transcript_93200/g.164871  ORF Transcript_93200/g.164871 Transcript_93200/m.164871 type:complete len:421 (-) Transcript_93200:158-1420(-)
MDSVMMQLRCCAVLMLTYASLGAGTTCDARSSLSTQESKQTEDRAMVLLQVSGLSSQKAAASLSRTVANATSKSDALAQASAASEWQQRWASANKEKQRLLEDRQTMAEEKESLQDLQTAAEAVQEVPIREADSAWNALAKRHGSKVGLLELEEAQAMQDLEQGGSSDSDADSEETEGDSDAAEDEAVGDEEDSADEDGEDSKQERRGRLSLMESADGAQLNEQGYEAVAATQDARRMEIFVRRLASDLGMKIVDEGALKGFVPYYSGQKDTQSFEAMREELLSSATPGGWVQFTSGGWRQFTSSVRQKEHMLIETGVTRNEVVKTSSSESASLGAQAVIFFTRIPQMTYDLFGYTTTAILCGTVLAAGLCLIDERKRTTKDLNSFLEPPLLNAGPEPPKQLFDNPSMNQKLEDLRAGKC